MDSRIHLDHNASALLSPPVLRMLQGKAIPHFQNGSAVHADGQRARGEIEKARDRVFRLVGLNRNEAKLIFTSGATESNNTIIYNIIQNFGEKGCENLPHVITSAIEHSCILLPLEHLEQRRKIILTKVYPRGREGLFAEDFAAEVTPSTSLVCCMAANNESGEVVPVKDIFQLVRAKALQYKSNVTPWCHCDGAQYLGKIGEAMCHIGADSYSLSGHKIGALAGVGALVINGEESRYKPLFLGGPQETFRRAGTENLLGIISFGLAAEHVFTTNKERIEAMTRSRMRLESFFSENPDLFSTSHFGKDQLPNTISLRTPGISGQDLVVGLDLAGVNISSGAACASGKPNPSHVLLAYGLTEKEARETIRVSLEPAYAEGELDRASKKIRDTISTMKNN